MAKKATSQKQRFRRRNRPRGVPETRDMFFRWPGNIFDAIERLAEREKRSINAQAEVLILESPTLQAEMADAPDPAPADTQ